MNKLKRFLEHAEVELWFLPSRNSAGSTALGKIAIEVLAQLDTHHVRGIALPPTQGLVIRKRL
ncbi:MAG: hypothetical protein R2729_03735 [Bryobacteraceae bacterium]